jgi:hypothetical protein
MTVRDSAEPDVVLAAYRRRYADFGLTFASERLAAEGLVVCPKWWPAVKSQ